jgi:hypothetical protein
MNSTQRKTLEAIFKHPSPANIIWNEVESLLEALEANVTQESSSRVRVELNQVRAVFHEPHPQKEIDKGAFEAVRDFLESAGIDFKEDD